MSTAITATPGDDYIWGSASFTWDSTESGKAWADASATNFTSTENEVLGVSILDARLPLSVRREVLAFTDTRQQSATANKLEALWIAQTYIDLIAFVLKVSESFALTEQSAKQIDPKAAVETLALSDAGIKLAAQITPGLFGFSGSQSGATQRISLESLSLADHDRRFTFTPKSEIVGLVEARQTFMLPDAQQSLILAETYTDIIGFILQVAEAFYIKDQSSHIQAHLVKEQLALLDRILRASNAVIADLVFRSTPLNEEEFANLIAQSIPLGFGAFRDLTPGDYEYSKALVRLVLEAPVTTANRVALSEARLNIDVPDVRDRGTATVDTTGTFVAFNRVFNAPPEIQATFKGGAVFAIPQIGAITTTGFELSLITPDTQVSVAGNASWSAEGY